MTPILWMFGTLLGNALDPVMWVGVVLVGLFCVRKKLPFLAPVGGAIVGVIVDMIIRLMSSMYDGHLIGGKIFAGVVYTSVVYAIIAWRLKAKERTAS